MNRWTRTGLLVLTILATTAGIAATSSAGSSKVGPTFKVGVLMPDTLEARWEHFDRPIFTKRLTAACKTCQVLHANAGGNQATQQAQAEAMIEKGVKVLVVASVDSVAAAPIVAEAHRHGVKVIGYDRQLGGAVDFQTGFDLAALGRLNGQLLLAAIKTRGLDTKTGSIIAVNGDQTTAGVSAIRSGWKSVLDGKVKIGREYYTTGWDPGTAQTEADQGITALGGPKNVIGVMAMNDGMAGGVIAALKAAGANPIPPVTGMDADVAAVQRILVGDQAGSVYNAPAEIASTAARVVATLAKTGKFPKADSRIKGPTGQIVRIAYTAAPEGITKATIKKYLIDTKVYSVAQICTAPYQSACRAAGLLH